MQTEMRIGQFCDEGIGIGGRGTQLEYAAGEKESELGEKEIADEDEHRRHDDGLRSCPSHALSAAANVQSLVAADGGENETEDKRLGHTLHDIGELESVERASPKLDGANAQGGIRDDEAAD